MTSILDGLGALLIGLAIGYVIASVLESYVHQHVGHAPGKSVKRWQRRPRLLGSQISTRYSHYVIHHRRTFKQDHVTQFRSDAEREQVDLELARHGAHGEQIKRSSYGLRLEGSGALVYAAPLLPALAMVSSPRGAWAVAGIGIMLALPPLLSRCFHPYLHMPHQRARREAPAVTAWLLERRYFRAMARNHYMHHRYMAFNFNLLLGGDVLRGCYRAPIEKDLLEMQRLGLRID